MPKKDEPILKTLQSQPGTKLKPRNKANQNHRKPKREPKTLKPVLTTRQKQPETLQMKRKLVEQKAKLENLLAENQPQT